MPYWVGTKKGLVVTWLTKTNFHLLWLGKLPCPPPPLLADDWHAAKKPGMVAAVVAMAAVRNSRRRVSRLPSAGLPSTFSCSVALTSTLPFMLTAPPSRGRNERSINCLTADQPLIDDRQKAVKISAVVRNIERPSRRLVRRRWVGPAGSVMSRSPDREGAERCHDHLGPRQRWRGRSQFCS